MGKNRLHKGHTRECAKTDLVLVKRNKWVWQELSQYLLGKLV